MNFKKTIKENGIDIDIFKKYNHFILFLNIIKYIFNLIYLFSFISVYLSYLIGAVFLYISSRFDLKKDPNYYNNSVKISVICNVIFIISSILFKFIMIERKINITYNAKTLLKREGNIFLNCEEIYDNNKPLENNINLFKKNINKHINFYKNMILNSWSFQMVKSAEKLERMEKIYHKYYKHEDTIE